jgi:hypothetical protein
MKKSNVETGLRPVSTVFVKALNQSYKFIDGHAVFYDGTVYEVNELLELSKPIRGRDGSETRLRDNDLQKIHLVKKMFQGEIL